MAITFTGLNYIYQANTPFEYHALKNINLTIPDDSYTAIIGHTGSGKSTLLQHLNGLLKPTSGSLEVNGQLITPQTKNKQLGALRRQVGFVFQFPEAQLFEETVLKDIAFGPQNFGKSQAEALEIAKQMAQLVNLPASLWEKSPFELSGGQMRRVAIAGILAMTPKTLILDEPTAGLDPKGRLEMMEMFYRLHQEEKLNIILVTHNMDDVANYADNVVVLEGGQVLKTGSPQEIFAEPAWLKAHHLGLPKTTAFAQKLVERGFKLDKLPLKEKQLAEKLVALMGGTGHE
ncbi:energy-coupling factor ABC transporter ATP-binding protein [Ligilactobacillus agilis]|uniref:energy-coupling factor ABC transporter ATP-binding protein n=1 Tax=Ligilactobacillus agilis TaxID=1601 RepID=UPI00255C43C2|nr:energy-coupling factor ABC transporter ATP-binding protein [Ligilactobacillus agilis]